MSTTITTTITTTFNNDPSFHVGGHYVSSKPHGTESCDIEHGHRHGGHGRDALSDAIDDLPLPGWIKERAKHSLGLGDCGQHLPSDSGAAKTINAFQKEHDIGLMSVGQMKQMAETGYFTDKNGKTIQVPEEVQLAAQKMMANNAELFKKMESATDGKHDGQLGKGDYNEAIKDGTISRNGDGGHTHRPRGISREDFLSAIMGGHISTNRPSDYGAAKTINDFQKEHDIGLLSVGQLKQMAETGYFTDKNGKSIQVPEEVQDAARAMMANNGELFKKMESATDGKHDGQLGMGDFDEALEDGTISRGSSRGSHQVEITLELDEELDDLDGQSNLPSRSGAAKTIHDFQKDNDIGLLGIDQIKQMAETGYFTDKDGKTKQVPEEVQLAAQKMLENNGELFKSLESASNGKHDGLLGQGDYDEALKDGTISKNTGGNGSHRVDITLELDDDLDEGADLPSRSGAAKTIRDFQKDNDISLLGIDQIKQMAETGYFTDKDGKTKQVPEEVQLAAQKMLENNGELFKSLESATTGKHDGLLSQGDYDEALKDGTISKNTGSNGPHRVDLPLELDDEVELPSRSAAAKTVRDFQKDNDISLLGIDQIKQMAETGYFTDKDGKTKQVPEEVQLAAQKMLENNGELFKSLESATTGKHDGLLSQGDYDEAIDDGRISA
ncbi:hypothetical protein MJ904_08750 [Massilia sp. MB5]|uniref:hypothetical protein n=1 Tax=Massilia sp. MB5 TaxID=2919578 RepID=UPI001F0FABC2|nr:hypothetical protein [Massilia sp. MB5]UMR32241.1 hypothetical protein MJ904_08750 [Massilia sp. MB5]